MFNKITKVDMYPHHVQGFRRIDENTVKNVQHSSTFPRCLRAKSAKQPIKSVRLCKLRTVGMVSFYNSGYNEHIKECLEYKYK